VCQARHEPDRALELHQQALDLHRELGDRRGEANELGRIGLVYQVRGDLDAARELYEQGLKAAQDVNYAQGAAELLGNLGLLFLARDEPEPALDRLLRALGLFMRTRAEGRMLNVVNSLHDVREKLGAERFKDLCGKAGLAGPEFHRLGRLLDQVGNRRTAESG
jgi:tetratricopeptide (TPR) repeat protein